MLLAIFPRTAWGPPAQRMAASMRRNPLLLVEERVDTVQTASRPTEVRGRGRVIRVYADTRKLQEAAAARVTVVQAMAVTT